ncbi:MAG TPA: AAA family ATPase [Chitinophagaceae bacterium]|jgi:wobble nucleotide-excising tRNase|nr:AAA family ATPase [Chitinophagaceae bacterium]HMU59207.1 AAA family ATPase [Chitinophagaceae bacterium]
MISRFTNIKGIGRFHDCNFGGRHFSKNTIIFGQNTGGKSTLADILWSFKTGNIAIIEGRKTFGYTGSQQVEFIDETNKQFKYPSIEWTQGFENIEIFDTQFINENIFEGNEITYGHQKNLHSIIIGTEGKKLATEINNLQEELNELTARKTAKTTEFNRTFKKEISVQEFSSLPKMENVDEAIKEIQATIETANNQAKIKSVFEAVETLVANIITQNTKLVLSNSIQGQAKVVSEHITKTWKNPNHSKDFLQTGLSLTKDEQTDCVFCGQKIDSDAKNLLSAFAKLFSQQYRTLQTEIANAVSKFEKWNPLSFLESIQDKLASVKISLPLPEFNKEKIKQLKEDVNTEFSTKFKDIGYEVDFKKYDTLIEVIKKVREQIDELKKKNVFTSEVNIEVLNKRIKQLEFTKIRHTKEWDEFLKEYDSIDGIQEAKKLKRETTREALNRYSINLFGIHFDTINKVLSELQADFRICDFQPIKRIVGQSERIFALKFFNTHKVSIDETSTGRPNFKNTLSESDKRVLAFAFFYSLMIHDEKLSEKIIVFDDPFSSFDSDRRVKTVQLLANPHLITPDGEYIEKEVNQLIILTHESEFFIWLFLKLDNPKPLRLLPDGDINGVKKSTLVDCNVYSEFIEDENLKNLKEIESTYSSNRPISNYEGLCVKCRKILESVFIRKYLFELEDEINTRKSVRTFVDKLSRISQNEFDKIPKRKAFIDLCDNLNIELHNNTLKNEGQNAQAVLGDFLKLIKQV